MKTKLDIFTVAAMLEQALKAILPGVRADYITSHSPKATQALAAYQQFWKED